MKTKAIQVHKLSKSFYLKNKTKVEVLNNVSLSAEYGEFISIIGASGSGKSTLLKCISSLLVPSSGEVLINNKNPYNLKNKELARLRYKDIGFIFQSYNLVPALPVLENIALPLRLSKKKLHKRKIEDLLVKLKFNADIFSFVGDLSGGEQQKVAIARVVVANSKIVFADEPTGALDSASRLVVFNLLKDMAKEGKCVFMVTHDIDMASKTDRALVISDGAIYKEIVNPTSEDLYNTIERIASW
ncbi:ABC transporter ATP-binding protein (plasmid) [Lactococcus lactis]|uniref:ABC transporter ATP-binding protein n=1 Tax=Lactococcus lactis TaxID=1358 RepID=UPI00331407F7